MSDTTTIGIDEIQAVAAKLDEGHELDPHDRVVVRALLVLAGERVADLAGAEVAGFAWDPGVPGLGPAVGFDFDDGQLTDAVSSSALFLKCCNGKHFKTVSLSLRKSAGGG